MSTTFSAVVLGATGGVGAHLVSKLLESPLYSRVTVVARRASGLSSPKLHSVIWADFSDALNKPDAVREVFRDHDVVFCCLGAREISKTVSTD